jgi:DNA-binding response OmpR family regulator
MAGERCRILVIEDDRETAEQLVDSLATSGYEVDLAVDGKDGLSRARSAKYAVMTIDRMLPRNRYHPLPEGRRNRHTCLDCQCARRD